MRAESMRHQWAPASNGCLEDRNHLQNTVRPKIAIKIKSDSNQNRSMMFNMYHMCILCILFIYVHNKNTITAHMPKQKIFNLPCLSFFHDISGEAIGSLRCNMPKHPKEIPCFQDAFSQGCSSASAADKRSSGSTSSRARKSPAPHELIINTHQWYSMDMQWYQYSIPKHCQIKEIDVEMLLWYLHPASDPVLQKSLAKPTWQVLVWLDGLATDLARAEKCWRSDGETQKTSGHNAYSISECLKVKRSELVSFSHCSKADLSINFEPSLWIASYQPSS